MANKKSGFKSLKTVVLLLIFTLAGFVFFYFLNPGKAIRFVFPDLNRINYINAKIRNDSAFTETSLVLQNRNFYKLKIDTVNFEIFLNDTSIAKQFSPLNIGQSFCDVDTIKLPLDLSIKKVKGLVDHLQGVDSTNVRVRGYINYQTPFGKTKIDFEKITRIEVPVPPEIKLVKLVRKDFDFKEKILNALASIEITNRGKNLDLQISHIHYDIIIEEELRTEDTIKKSIRIKPRSSVLLNIPLKIKVYHPLKIVWLIKTDQDKLNYRIKLNCGIKENISEKTFFSVAEVNASGILEVQK